MNKAYVLILLSTIYMTQCVKLIVEYDKQRDLIIHEGKVYLPVQIDKENENSHNSGEGHEEELATGASFVFYLICTFRICF